MDLRESSEALADPHSPPVQLIFSFFKTLTNQPITIELKNDVAITGTLKSVDQFLNFRIENLRVVGNDAAEAAIASGQAEGQQFDGSDLSAQAKWPHLVSWQTVEWDSRHGTMLTPFHCHSSHSSQHSSEDQWSGMSMYPLEPSIRNCSRMLREGVSAREGMCDCIHNQTLTLCIFPSARRRGNVKQEVNARRERPA